MRRQDSEGEDRKNRVRVVNLPTQDRDLDEREADQIRGGGAGGGVVIGSRRPVGEEIRSAQ